MKIEEKSMEIDRISWNFEKINSLIFLEPRLILLPDITNPSKKLSLLRRLVEAVETLHSQKTIRQLFLSLHTNTRN